jgi:hypothetical protein
MNYASHGLLPAGLGSAEDNAAAKQATKVKLAKLLIFVGFFL